MDDRKLYILVAITVLLGILERVCLGARKKMSKTISNGREVRIAIDFYGSKWHVSVFGGKGFSRGGYLIQQHDLYKNFDGEADARKYVGELKIKFGVAEDSVTENIGA